MRDEEPSRDRELAIAIACGFTALPVASLFSGIPMGWLRGPEATVVPTIVAAGLAGAITGAITAQRSATPQTPFDAVPTRAGFLAAVLAAALLVLRTTLLYATPGSIALPGLITLFTAAVSVLPATLVANFLGGTGRAMRLATRREGGSGMPILTFRPILLLYIACGLALLSPFVPGCLSSPRSPVVGGAPAARANARVLPPAVPSFTYRKPEGFEKAPASSLSIIAQQSLPELSRGSAIAFSPNSRFVAFHPQADSDALIIFDLEQFAETARINIGASTNALVWSPDGSRLAGVVGGNQSRHISILVPEQARAIRLPRPESMDIPEGDLSWTDQAEVILHPKSGNPLALNLETLRLRPLEDAPFFNALPVAAKESVRNASTPSLPRMAKWSMSFGWALHSTGRQIYGEDFTSLERGRPSLVNTDLESGTRRHVRALQLGEDHLILLAPDATKALLVNGSNASVAYFGTREPPKVLQRLSMRLELQESSPAAKSLEKAIAEQRLGAFVYPPLINPLNNQTIGPDYTTIKALLRIRSWKDTQAEVWTQDEFLPLQPGDVVSALHTWEGQVPKKPLEGAPFDSWTIIEASDFIDAAASTPPGKNAPPLEIGPALDVRRDRHSFAIVGTRQRAVQQPAAPISEPKTSPPPSTGDAPPIDPRIIEEFIHRHHAKSSAGDINGLVADYAATVEHYDKGLVDQEFIRKEEEAYHAPGNSVKETVRGQMRIDSLGGKAFSATYCLDFMQVKPTGEWVRGASDVVLLIEIQAGKPRIFSQRSTSRASEKRKGRGTPPAL